MANNPTAPTTAVPFPTLGPNGFVIPAESAILAGVISDINAAFGNNLNFENLSTPQGQLATSMAAIIGDSFSVFQWMCNMFDPAYSVGRTQDALGRIYFIERVPGTPSVCTCTLNGLNNVEIPIGAIAQDPSGNLWLSQGSGIIANGSLTLQFANSVIGPTTVPASLTIYQTIPGWDSITPGAGVLGTLTETPAQFENRRANSTGLNSMGPLNAIYGAVLAVPGVIDCFCIQNDSGSPTVVGGVSIAANSIYVCPLGGTSSAIAQAIFTRKMPGCGMTGNTSVTVYDTNPAYNPGNQPSYTIKYQTPTLVPMAVVATIANSAIVPGDAIQQVQAGIISAFAGLDGGPRAKIGSTLYGSRYYPTVSNLGTTFVNQTGQVIQGWSAPIISLQLGPDGTQATATASISGTTLTVSALTSGTILVNCLVEGSGLFIGGIGGPNLVGSGVVITSQINGTIGSTGQYQLANTVPTVPSGTFTFTYLQNDYTLNINQAPSVAATNIYLNLVTVPI